MKRFVLCGLLMAAVAVSMAQAPFTIVRPADGSKVRETVKVLLPKHSIPQGGYVGVFLDGAFIEAMAPRPQGDYYVYMLDTKARGIADGVHTLEFVLYADYSGRPEITERSSIEITVANKASIPIPKEGFALRYRFQPGQEYIYNLKQRVTQSTVSEAQNRLGGRGAEQGSLSESLRLQYVVANRYGDGDALMRIMALPEKGKNFILFTETGKQEASTFKAQDMNPIFMRLSNTGMEEFSTIPSYFGLFGTSAKSATPVQVIAAYPLPTLPTKRVKPGDVWQSRFQLPNLNLDITPRSGESLVESIPARAEFLEVEWQSGHPCAKIKHSYSQGTGRSGGTFADDMLAIEETIWFALDKGTVVRVVRTVTMDARIDNPAQQPAGTPPGFDEEIDPRLLENLPPEQRRAILERRGMPARPTAPQSPQYQRIKIGQTFTLE